MPYIVAPVFRATILDAASVAIAGTAVVDFNLTAAGTIEYTDKLGKRVEIDDPNALGLFYQAFGTSVSATGDRIGAVGGNP